MDILVDSISNMATSASMDLLNEAVHPGIFGPGDDVEQFIKKCSRYFETTGIKKGLRSVLVVAFLARELGDAYENKDPSLEYEERLRKTFYRPSSMMEDLKKANNYKRNAEHLAIYKKRSKKWRINYSPINGKKKNS